jgi:hypothetical protein
VKLAWSACKQEVPAPSKFVHIFRYLAERLQNRGVGEITYIKVATAFEGKRANVAGLRAMDSASL